MDIKPTLRLRLFLAFFTLFIGSHVFIMHWEIRVKLRHMIKLDYLGNFSVDLDTSSIEFLLKVLVSLVIGMLIFPRFIDESKLSNWDKFMFSCFTFLFLITFATSSILQMFSPGSSYFYHLSETLYFTPFFLLSGFYILPRYICGDEYKPWKSFLGGIKLCALILPFAFFYDFLNQLPSFLSDQATFLETRPEEDHFFIYIGYYINNFADYTYGYYWYLLVLPISGISAWVAQLYLYHHRDKYWPNNSEIFA